MVNWSDALLSDLGWGLLTQRGPLSDQTRSITVSFLNDRGSGRALDGENGAFMKKLINLDHLCYHKISRGVSF